jgi:hypothetical protein
MENNTSTQSQATTHARPVRYVRAEELGKYVAGTRLVVVSSVGLGLTSAALLGAIIAGQNGDDGAVYSALLAEPVAGIFLLILLGNLASTSLRRTPLPRTVRRRRLAWSVVGCLCLLAVMVASRLIQ